LLKTNPNSLTVALLLWLVNVDQAANATTAVNALPDANALGSAVLAATVKLSLCHLHDPLNLATPHTSSGYGKYRSYQRDIGVPRTF